MLSASYTDLLGEFSASYTDPPFRQVSGPLKNNQEPVFNIGRNTAMLTNMKVLSDKDLVDLGYIRLLRN
ncbi:MAG: hypothetical protein FJX70_05035 [Alphaproteobacteria bacterium]|jgi:hypothetical protein|nr:hypothetical protein [Alphaproteobacteria bacterium]